MAMTDEEKKRLEQLLSENDPAVEVCKNLLMLSQAKFP